METKDPFGLVKLKVSQLLKTFEYLVRSFKSYQHAKRTRKQHKLLQYALLTNQSRYYH